MLNVENSAVPVSTVIKSLCWCIFHFPINDFIFFSFLCLPENFPLLCLSNRIFIFISKEKSTSKHKKSASQKKKAT